MKLCGQISVEPCFAMAGIARAGAAAGVPGSSSPGTWVWPDDYLDADEAWIGEESTYDDDPATYAQAQATDSWFELLLPCTQLCCGIRFVPQVMAGYTVDIHTLDGWTNVFTGLAAVPAGTWKTVSFDAISVDKARFKTSQYVKLYEVQFLQAFEMGGSISAEGGFGGVIETGTRFAGEVETEPSLSGTVSLKGCS